MTTDCVSTRSVSSTSLRPERKEYRIVSILKKTGERLDINKSNPARVVGNEIHISGVLKVPAAGITVVKTDGGFMLTTDRGSAYEASDLGRSGDRIEFRTKFEITIPLSDVSMVWTRESNFGLTVLAVMGGIALAGLSTLVYLFLTHKIMFP